MIRSAILSIALVVTAGVPNTGLASEFGLAGVDQFCDDLKRDSICMAISLTGKIESGDAQKLRLAIEQAEAGLLTKTNLKGHVSLVLLDSPGGNIYEGIAIGTYLRSKQISTCVGKGDVCASACVLVLAGGVKRMPAGKVIIHSFYAPSILGTNDFVRSEKLYKEAADKVDLYLADMRVSRSLLEAMIQVPHSSQKALSVDTLLQMGLLGIDPAYDQARKK